MHTKSRLMALASYVEDLERVRNHAMLLAESALADPEMRQDAEALIERIRYANHSREECEGS